MVSKIIFIDTLSAMVVFDSINVAVQYSYCLIL